MKKHLDITHEDGLGDVLLTKTMGFHDDRESVAFLMASFTDLYSDKELAPIREITTNALDSHIAAGNPDPIEVTLPTRMLPEFVVRDNGVGLSLEQITDEMFSYGFSSKRDTDAEVGMFGLGSKSPLTYTSQFTVIARKDGILTTALITRAADGGGVVQIIDKEPTDERNGVEVRIPVDNIHSFSEKVRDFLRYWDSTQVTVTNAELQSIWSDTKVITLEEGVVLVPSDYVTEDVIVMGNVPYKIPTEHLQPTNHYRHYRHNRGYEVVARVPMGSVDFPPSRETLQFTARTNDTLAELKNWIDGARAVLAQKAVSAAPTPLEALKEALRWQKAGISITQLSYRGRQVPSLFGHGSDRPTHLVDSIAYSHRGQAAISVQAAVNSVLVLGAKQGAGEATRTRLFRWAQDKNLPLPHNFLLTPEHLDEFWLGELTTVDIADIRKIDIGTGTGTRTYKKYRFIRGAKWSNEPIESDDAPDNMVAWMEASAVRSRPWRQERYRDDETIAVVLGRDLKSFQAAHPTVPHFKQHEDKILEWALTTLTPAEWTWRHNTSRLAFAEDLMLGELLDQELIDLARQIEAIDQWRASVPRGAITQPANYPEFKALLEKLERRYAGLHEAPSRTYNAIYMATEQIHLHPFTY